jgi:hypothetical protein
MPATTRAVKLEASIQISPDEIRDLLRPPDSFGYLGDNADMFETWTLGPVIRTRDSDLLEQSNADALEKHLRSDPTLSEDWEITGCRHWAVGWVDHLSYRVIDDNGAPTRIARVIAAWFKALEDYPVADEDDWGTREFEATLDNIADAGKHMVRADAPDSWVSDAFSWFWKHNQCAVESYDGNGGYPSDDDMRECLEALGYLESENDNG